MSDSNRKKQEYYLSIKETAEKLRMLADELERGVVVINEEECSIAPDAQVKISLKTKDDSLSTKLKFKLENPLSKEEKGEGGLAPPTELGIENYKDLKKRMSIDFKAIKKSCVQEQTIPNPKLVARFYLDLKKMCTYPNKGEELYETFLKHANCLYDAFKASDLKAMNSAIESLVQTRNDCHSKHK